MTSKTSRPLLSATLALALLAGTAGTAAAQDASGAGAAPAGIAPATPAPPAVPPKPLISGIGISMGSGRIIVLPHPVANIFAADPNVVEVRPASPTSKPR